MNAPNLDYTAAVDAAARAVSPDFDALSPVAQHAVRQAVLGPVVAAGPIIAAQALRAAADDGAYSTATDQLWRLYLRNCADSIGGDR